MKHTIYLMMLFLALQSFSQNNNHDHDPNMANLTDDFAYIAPTHVTYSESKSLKVLDAYSVRLLMNSPKTDIWFARVFSDKNLFMAYKTGDKPPNGASTVDGKCPDDSVCYQWENIKSLNRPSYDDKKYGAFLGIINAELINYHTLVLPDEYQDALSSYFLNVHMRLFDNDDDKEDYDKYFSLAYSASYIDDLDDKKNKFIEELRGYITSKRITFKELRTTLINIDSRTIKTLSEEEQNIWFGIMAHKGTIHFPSGGD